MIRFILKTKIKSVVNAAEMEEFHTIDADVPELEKILLSGVFSEDGYEFTVLAGIELLEDKK